ncbi:hypothetical protein [Pseudoxanthomonas winnipegensis]|uniref:Uncharacterized protein n=1 Tax=Pseudoxanthomonas winnipegensis TaxID=2480810 RepID=A0A4Q8M6E4_9GAMM|nr:hypothetical protein [Pseudoxanthomonas winnipegensis]TAA45650.1 hypothetical protein EA655_05535 [Pseudoxanthomonas winnipegensis]
MKVPTWLYVTESAAIASGLTHEGRLFGCPAWLRLDSEEHVVGTPKVPALAVWCCVVDRAMDLATCFLSADTVVVTPITVGRLLRKEGGAQ